MPNKSVSELTSATALGGTEEIHVVQGGTSKKTTARKVLDQGNLSINAQTGTTYTLVNNDLIGGVIVECDNAAAITLTVPAGLTNVNPVTIIQKGAGTVTLAAGVGATILSTGGALAVADQYSAATLIPIGSDNYYLVGALV